jgi:hypothetical protein
LRVSYEGQLHDGSYVVFRFLASTAGPDRFTENDEKLGKGCRFEVADLGKQVMLVNGAATLADATANHREKLVFNVIRVAPSKKRGHAGPLVPESVLKENEDRLGVDGPVGQAGAGVDVFDEIAHQGWGLVR